MGWINQSVQQVQAVSSGGSLLSSSQLANIGTTAFEIVTLEDVSNYASYDLSIYLYAVTPGAAGSPIVAGVTLYWFDDLTSNIPVFEETWNIWVGRAPSGLSFGIFGDACTATGPMHGRYITVVVSIPVTATSNVILQYFNLFGSPRSTSFSDWRQNAALVNPQATSTVTDTISSTLSGYDNVICQVSNASVPASSKVFLPFNLYAGVFNLFIFTSIAATFCFLAAADNILAGDVWTNNPVALGSLALAAGSSTSTFFIAPRAPCYLSMTSGAGGATTFSFTAIAQQGI